MSEGHSDMASNKAREHVLQYRLMADTLSKHWGNILSLTIVETKQPVWARASTMLRPIVRSLRYGNMAPVRSINDRVCSNSGIV